MNADIAVALRTIRRAPVGATLTVLALAAGIGAAVAIYTVVQGVLLFLQPWQRVWRRTIETNRTYELAPDNVRVCGIAPSGADTTRIAPSICAAPVIMFLM